MKLRPIGDKVVVQPTERATMTPSGIVLPDTSKEKPQEGKVLAVGPGRLLENGDHASIDVKEGDRVIYSKYSGTEFKRDGEELLVLSERDILAVID
jgi:chaperonin GroES